MSIYKYSHFTANSSGHGGEKRTAQINDLLTVAHLQWMDMNAQLLFPPAKDLMSFFRGMKHFTAGLKNMYSVGRYIIAFESFIDKFRPSMVLWEATNEYDLLLARVLKDKHIPFIALPHNLESLVSGSSSMLSNKKSPNWLAEEIEYLGYSKHIFTISKEEQWLLALHGCNAWYLPYFPSHSIRKQLLGIRNQRIKKAPVSGKTKKVLLIGTFYNPPTLNGYKALLQYIKGIANIEFNVAGYGSELLNNTISNSNVKIWGSVSAQVLEDLLISCDFAIIHQEPTSGALTRIPELLTAGIPIIANYIAARSFYNCNGVHIYQDNEELVSMIYAFKPLMPKLPERPVEEAQFVAYMIRMISDLQS
jgi:hypothetical protein